MKRRIHSIIEQAKILGAVKKLQNWFRAKKAKDHFLVIFTQRMLAAQKIQRNYKSTRWVRIMNRLSKERKMKKVVMVQKYIRGYLSRNKTATMLKDYHLGSSLDDYFGPLKV